MNSGHLLPFLLDLQRDCGGVIPFDRYMKEALYHPKFGYYSTRIGDIGEGGDFSTSATLDKGLSIALAAWITEKAASLGWQRIPVIEIGAGNGSLARVVLRHLPWRTRRHTDYMIHETSPRLQQLQRKLLRWQGVQWINSLPEALSATGGRALIFSNELADAFPCRLFQKSRGEWREIGVQIDERTGLSEVFLGGVADSPWFAQFKHLPEGQRVERGDAFRNWQGSWHHQWKEGACLTIDYGTTAELLYEKRISGSLRAYWKHQRLTGKDLYARFGRQDLTADVNFSDLIRWGRELGWKTLSFMKQREFEKTWIPEKRLLSLSSRFDTCGDAGDAFQILEQTPN